MASDLLGIGSSGLQAQQKMLATTSNNISNVNTQGYSRQNTVLYSNQDTLGVGSSSTRRMIDTFAQTEVLRDTAVYNKTNTTYTELSFLDQYLSDSATSLSTTINSYFSAMQSANSSPNNASDRQGIMGQLSTVVTRFQSVSSELSQQYDNVNNKIDTELKGVNSLLSSINDLNVKISKTVGLADDGTRSNLMDQRDEMVRQLSEKLDIRVVKQDNDTVQVNLNSGESLVLSGNYATLSTVIGNPDPKQTSVQIKMGNATTTANTDMLGATVGGYFAARDSIADVQRETGQLALAFADAMNTQNRLGMTLNNTIGGDLFTVPASDVLANSNNIGTGSLTISPIAGQMSNLPPNDLQISFTGATTYTVYRLDGNTKTLIGNDTVPASNNVLAGYGLQMTLTGAPANGDSFLVQPTKNAAGALTANISRAEDLALASPLKLNASANNYSSAKISLTGVYNTDSTTSSFTASSLKLAAPHTVLINSTGDYELYDGNSPQNLLATVPASSNGQDLLATSGIYANAQTNPGFEISIDGIPKPGDQFNISFNTDGFSDNKNGLALAGLQTKDMVRKGSSTAADNKMTFNEAFSSTLTTVGTEVNGLNTSKTAANAKLSQSSQLYDSVAGVNLDEEAANLVRYQQAYSASAKVITAAQSTFDSLLSALR